jgi:hypothetical protein
MAISMARWSRTTRLALFARTHLLQLLNSLLGDAPQALGQDQRLNATALCPGSDEGAPGLPEREPRPLRVGQLLLVRRREALAVAPIHIVQLFFSLRLLGLRTLVHLELGLCLLAVTRLRGVSQSSDYEHCYRDHSCI